MLGLVLFANTAWSEEPWVSDLPDPEIAWIIQNSPVGARDDNPNRLTLDGFELSVEIPRPELRGVDLEFGRRLLEEPPVIEIVRPESLVGL